MKAAKRRDVRLVVPHAFSASGSLGEIARGLRMHLEDLASDHAEARRVLESVGATVLVERRCHEIDERAERGLR